MKFDFIAAESAHKTFDVEFMCRMLEVSSSGFYARRKRRICVRKRDDLALREVIRREFKKYPRGCGSRRAGGRSPRPTTSCCGRSAGRACSRR